MGGVFGGPQRWERELQLFRQPGIEAITQYWPQLRGNGHAASWLEWVVGDFTKLAPT